MALPSNWTQVKVYGTYLRLDGTPNSGQIWFETETPVSIIDDAGDTVLVVPKRIVADIDDNGYFEVMLPSTTDPDVAPKGWTYEVKERITRGLEYSIDVPSDLISLNLVPMRPKLPEGELPPATLNYLTTEDLGNTVARQGDMNTTNALLATAAADATAAISTANSTVATANAAAETANAASAIASTLGDQVAAAQTTANGASAAAGAAQTAATNAGTNATNALNLANSLTAGVTQAQTDAASALSAAGAAQAAATDAQTAASGALSTANGLADDVAAAQSTADGAAGGLVTYKTDLASQTDATKGSALIGHVGQTLREKLFAIDDAIAAGGGSGSGTFTPPGTGAVVRSVQSKLSDAPISMLDYYHSADAGDYAPAIRRALAVSSTVYIPRGLWKIATPLELSNLDATIIGDPGSYYANSDGTEGSVLKCTSSFLRNTGTGDGATHRGHVRLRDLRIQGPGSLNGIDGEMGGYVERCLITGWARGVYNPAGFLTRYVETRFVDCSDTGLWISDFNGGTVKRCTFESDCAVAINTSGAATDTGGQGYPFIVSECMFNGGDRQNGNSVCKLRGTFEFSNNYWEDYTASDTGKVFVEVVMSKFDKASFSVHHNEVNGHGNTHYGVMVRGATTGPFDAGGEIHHNRFLGMVKDVHMGDKDATTNANIDHVRVYDNASSNNTVVDGGAAYRPMGHSRWNAGASPFAISAAAALPIGSDSDTRDIDPRGNGFNQAGTYTIQKNGVWRVQCIATAGTTGTANLDNIAFTLNINGAIVERANCQLVANAGGAKVQTSAVLETTRALVSGDTIQIIGSGGDFLSHVSFTAQWVCDKDCWA